jgi:hypothetical protein
MPFSELDTVRDAVAVLKPLAEEAKADGNLRPSEILRNLEALDVNEYSRPLGENVKDAERVLKEAELPSGKSWGGVSNGGTNELL